MKLFGNIVYSTTVRLNVTDFKEDVQKTLDELVDGLEREQQFQEIPQQEQFYYTISERPTRKKYHEAINLGYFTVGGVSCPEFAPIDDPIMRKIAADAQGILEEMGISATVTVKNRSGGVGEYICWLEVHPSAGLNALLADRLGADTAKPTEAASFSFSGLFRETVAQVKTNVTEALRIAKGTEPTAESDGHMPGYLGKFRTGAETHWVQDSQLSADKQHFAKGSVACDYAAPLRRITPVVAKGTDTPVTADQAPSCDHCASTWKMNQHLRTANRR